MRNEEPPNKAVHAEDLADALGKLRAANDPNADNVVGNGSDNVATAHQRGQRSRSSTIVFNPVDQGHSPDLPAIAVEDTGFEEAEVSPMDVTESKAFVHTARPPVELME